MAAPPPTPTYRYPQLAQVALSNGDETGSFGPRRETGSSLFQIETLATIGASGAQTDEVPHIYAASSEDGLCVAAGSQVHLFDNRCNTLHTSLSLDGTAELVAWSDDASFLVVATSNGVLHFIDVTTKKRLFSQELFKNPTASAAFASLTFSAQAQTGAYEMVALSRSGALFCFVNIDLAGLRNAIAQGNMAAAKQVKAGIAVNRADVSKVHDEVVGGVLPVDLAGTRQLLVWGGGASAISLWELNEGTIEHVAGVSRLLKGVHIKKCDVTPDGKMVVLDTGGNLSLWLLPELVMVTRGPGAVDDFVLTRVEDEDTQSRDTLLVFGPTSRSQGEFKVMSLSGFEAQYTLELHRPTYLVNCTDPETMHVLEMKRDDDGANKIHIRCMTPTLPTNRFYHLLHKQRFKEAMDLATMFGLDTEMVHRVRVTNMLDVADKDPTTPDLLQSLKECLDAIDDKELLVDSCVQASLPTSENIQFLLEYGLQRLRATSDDPDADLLCTRIFGAIKRLGTFQIAVPAAFSVRRAGAAGSGRTCRVCWPVRCAALPLPLKG